jgi:DNA primase
MSKDSATAAFFAHARVYGAIPVLTTRQGVSMTAIDEIKARIDIVDLVSESVKLRKTGKNYTGFCPFHANTRTPAFVVFPDSGTWRCFGQCNEGGDIFRYVMKKEGWDFPETLRHLAEKAGVTLESPSQQEQADADQYERLRTLLEDAVIFYRHNLQKTAPGNEAQAYLHKRGILDETIEKFELGYAPDSWDALLNYFKGKGYTFEEIRDAGMLTERQDGSGGYDRFRHRLMIPIRDASGRMVGFGARILRPDDVPKFLNSPQTVLFDKGRLLYGLNQARKPIRSQDQVVIVEGYLDVIALHQQGFPNAVSPMGTALTEDQLRMLKRFTRRIILALDADAAGEKATLRGLEVARQALDHSGELAFDARGLLRNEARLQADIRVTTIPDGLDPDDVALRDPAEWERIIAEARPIVIHVMESLAAGRSLDDPKTKSEIAAQVIPLINDVPDPVERDAYRQRLARLLKVDELALAIDGSAAPARNRRRPNIQTPPARTAKSNVFERGGEHLASSMEQHFLRLWVRQPEVIYTIDRTLQTGGLSRVIAQDFEYSEHQAMARLMLTALEQEEMDPAVYLNERCPAALSDLLTALQAPLLYGEVTPSKRLEDMLRTLLKLRLLRVDEGLRQMRFMQEDVQENGETDLIAYQEVIPQYIQARGRLEAALAKADQAE